MSAPDADPQPARVPEDVRALTERLAEAHRELARYRRQAVRQREAVMAAERDQKIAQLTARVERLNEALARRQERLEDLRSSREFRVGRVLLRAASRVRHPLRTVKRRASRSTPSPPSEPAARKRSELPGPPAVPTDVETTIHRRGDDGPVDVSIVIPVFNAFDVTRGCIESIDAMRADCTFEVIAVDNGSDADVGDWLRAQVASRARFSLVANSGNLGFARAVNQGAALARGDAILICNNDVVLTDGCLDRLVGALRADDRLAVASPVTNFVGNGAQIDPGAVGLEASSAGWYARHLASVERALEPVPDRLVFFCVLVRRSAFEALGGLAEEFGLGNYEDDDFCVRARMNGWTLAVDPNAFVFHHGSHTWRAMGGAYDEWLHRNRRVHHDRLAAMSTTRPSRRRPRPSRPEVSVIVRTIDRPGPLRDALTSLANQTCDSLEVVLVNDGGPGLEPLLGEFADVLNVRPVALPRPGGRGAALNAGVETARADRIAFCDDDDLVYPIHLDVLLDELRRTGFPVAYSDADKVLLVTGEDVERVVARQGYGSFDPDPRELLVSNRIPLHTLLIDRRELLAAGGFDAALPVYEDHDFLIRLSERVPFAHVRRVTCEYRLRIGGEVTNTMVLRRPEHLQAMRELYRRYPTSDREITAKRDEVLERMTEQLETARGLTASGLPPGRQALEMVEHMRLFTTVDADAVEAALRARPPLAAPRTSS